MIVFRWSKLLAVAFGIGLTLAGIVLTHQHIRAGDDKATGANHSALKIHEPWARATPGGVTIGAAYVKITTENSDGDRLIEVNSPAAGRSEIHTHVMDGDVMKMRKVDALKVSQDRPLRLSPGGDHIMLFDLKEPLKPGTTIPLTLTFEKAGSKAVQATVLDIGSNGPDSTVERGSASNHDQGDRGSGAGHEDHRGSGVGGNGN